MRNMKLLFTVLLLAGLAAGCAQGDASAPPSDGSSPSDKSAVPGLCSANLYELTDNNFEVGLDYDFTEEELVLWQAVLDNLEDIAEAEPSQTEDPRYLIRLYDGTESEIACFSLDRQGNLFTEDGRKVENEAITELLKGIIAPE